MAIRTARHDDDAAEHSGINVPPVVGVALVLPVIFMIASPVDTESVPGPLPA